jgi:hypothetical protein
VLLISWVSPPPKTKAANTKGKGKGKATKGKGKASQNQVPDEPEWLPGWNFLHKKRIPRTLSKLIQPQLDYIEQMIKGWRPPAPKKMGMPEDWFVRLRVSVPIYMPRTDLCLSKRR